MSDFKQESDLLKAKALNQRNPQASKFIKKLVTSKHWPEICERFFNSENVKTIAAYIQGDLKEMTEYTHNSLIRNLYHTVDFFYDDLIYRQAPNKLEFLLKTISNTFEPKEFLTLIAGIQFERTMIAFANEARLKKLDDKNTTNIKILIDIVKTSAEISNIKSTSASGQSANLADSIEVLEKQKNYYKEKFGPIASEILVNPDSRQRVLQLIELVKAGNTGRLSEIINQRSREGFGK